VNAPIKSVSYPNTRVNGFWSTFEGLFVLTVRDANIHVVRKVRMASTSSKQAPGAEACLHDETNIFKHSKTLIRSPSTGVKTPNAPEGTQNPTKNDPKQDKAKAQTTALFDTEPLKTLWEMTNNVWEKLGTQKTTRTPAQIRDSARDDLRRMGQFIESVAIVRGTVEALVTTMEVTANLHERTLYP